MAETPTEVTRDPAVQRVLRHYAERKDGHNKFCAQVQDRYRAYLGLIDDAESDSLNWTSRLAPPYAMQVVEGVVANLLDDRTRFQVRPRPRMDSPEEQKKATDGARALELLLSYQLDADRFNEKQRAYALQNCIAGLTVAKVYWRTDIGPRHELQGRDELDFDVYGLPTGSRRVLEEQSVEDVLYDGPCFDPFRVEDFIWEEAAETLQGARWVIHRSAATLDDLKKLEQQGVYRNVSKLTKDENDSYSDEYARVQEELYGDKRFKGRHELWEFYSREGEPSLITIADRKVNLTPEGKEYPFWHGQYPFVVCSTSPDLFRIPGISMVQKVKQLQEYLWSLINQRLDNLKLLNNAIYAVRDDMLDTDQLEFYPGAIWRFPGSVQESVQQLPVDPTVGNITLAAEAIIKGDIQNVTGGMPFMAGVDSGEMQQTTATGVSIVTSIAQKMVMAQKQQLAWSYERAGDQFCALTRQFMRDPVLVQIIGADGAAAYNSIDPESIHGFDYHVNLDVTSESLMRQERRAEAQALLQVAAQAAGVFAAIAQGDPSGQKRTLNMEAFMEDLLRAYEKDDLERYFSVMPQMPMAQPGGNGGGVPGMPGQPAPGGGEGDSMMGVTAPQAYDASSPSSSVSLSPEVFLQRAMAMNGRTQ